MSQNSEAPPAAVDDGGVSEIILFGVRVKVDPMRKSVSMNNLSEYEPANKDLDGPMENGIKVVPPKAAAEERSGGGYASADDDAAPGPNGNLQRRRGVPWSEEEHGLFLIGLDRIGRGDWRGISRNFVKTRTPTQVASHAQKYFIRRNNFSRRCRRSSLFDMTTDTATAMQIEKANSKTEESHAQPRTANSKGFSVGPASLSMQNCNTKEKSSLDQNNMIKTPSTMVDPNLNHKACIEALPLSLRLSLSWAQDQPFTASSDHGMMPSLMNGDNYITVA